eukprot:5224560-Amphidinium_carterae.1
MHVMDRCDSFIAPGLSLQASEQDVLRTLTKVLVQQVLQPVRWRQQWTASFAASVKRAAPSSNQPIHKHAMTRTKSLLV